MGIDTDLKVVVEDSEERSQREGCHKQSGETVLDYQLQVLEEQSVLVDGDKVVVLLPASEDILFSFLFMLQAVYDTLHIATTKQQNREIKP